VAAQVLIIDQKLPLGSVRGAIDHLVHPNSSRWNNYRAVPVPQTATPPFGLSFIAGKIRPAEACRIWSDMSLEPFDRTIMKRCIGLSTASGNAGEYPYAAIICRQGVIVAESMNRVRHDGDVTRHAEVVAISQAQRKLGTVSLDDCEIYINAEPCVFCGYAIRESRIRRVVYGLSSPHMGGVSKWNVLGDTDLSVSMPEVFAPPPEIISGYMEREAEQGLVAWNPLLAEVIKRRGLFAPASPGAPTRQAQCPDGMRARMLRFLRRNLFDRFGRK
jgi:tRNA(adenine34) deaminase